MAEHGETAVSLAGATMSQTADWRRWRSGYGRTHHWLFTYNNDDHNDVVIIVVDDHSSPWSLSSKRPARMAFLKLVS